MMKYLIYQKLIQGYIMQSESNNDKCPYERISNTLITVCPDKYFNKLKLATSMSIPRRCGGRDFINGISGYHFGGCFVPEEIIDFHH